MRQLALLFALVLVVAACGDDDTATTTTAPDAPTTTSATTDAPTTTAAPTTTVAPTTTAPPTTVDPAAARAAAAAAFAGDYSGTWQNTTFGSTGSIDASVVVDEAARFVIVTVDLGGNVFGGTDPDPVVFEVDLTQEPPYTFQFDLLGEATFDVADDGTFTLEAPSIPGLGGLPMTVEGSLDGETTYTIGDGAGGVFAEGVITLS